MKTYSNNEIEVSFDADRCIHTGECVNRLPSVFDVVRDPWINVNGAGAEKIFEVVGKCPSGALSCDVKGGGPSGEGKSLEIKVMPGGPYLIQGNVILTDDRGGNVRKDGGCALCRCGASKSKPFCDGSHQNLDF